MDWDMRVGSEWDASWLKALVNHMNPEVAATGPS